MISHIIRGHIRNGKATNTHAEAVLNELEKYEKALRDIADSGVRMFPNPNDYLVDSAFQLALAKYELAEIARDALYGERVDYGERGEQ